MRIPQLLAGVLVARQAVQLPSTFCSPECPSCKTEVGLFDGATTSCVPNSSFIQDCGHCQSCVETYAIENGGIASLSQLEEVMINILNLCENVTAVSTDIAALQSQASRLSVLGAELASTTDPALATMTGSITLTTPPTATSSEPAWMTMTGDAANNPSFASSTSLPNPTQSATPGSLNPTWIAGPVVGSVMGICTVITVIFFTRRKQRREQAREDIKLDELEKPKLFHDADSAHSPSAPEKAQLHAESAPPVEVEVHEVHELPAVEPVGSELSTPMEARMREEEWPVSPMPLSPLPLLFAMTEMRDQRNGVGDVSPRHDTFYHP
ncbi:hypothetical protein N431DRAFT_337466 [Stipitochalara longipes BDJ]|nr:hypothetical protein N431DRAFT_337466 [Stipitochalara longipes BDJ]